MTIIINKIIVFSLVTLIIIPVSALETQYRITIDNVDTSSASSASKATLAPEIQSSVLVAAATFKSVGMTSKKRGFGVRYLITRSNDRKFIYQGESFIGKGEANTARGSLETGKITLVYNEKNDSVSSLLRIKATSGSYNVVVSEI